MTTTAVSPALTMTEDMQKEIVKKAADLIARVSASKGLLSIHDLSAITGFARNGRALYEMTTDPTFPKPVYIGTHDKRWFSGEVFRWIERRR